MWLPSRRAPFTVQYKDRPMEEFEVDGEDQIVHMLDNFSRAALEGQPSRLLPEEAVQTLRVLDALAKSAREGRVVTV
jgi:hypothetical protein